MQVAIYLFIVTIFGIIVSGPFGRLSDVRGRRVALAGAATLNCLGDLWMCVCGKLGQPICMMFLTRLSIETSGI
jgi:MFS family permease